MKIVAISDTHTDEVPNLPKADLLIHAGDWSGGGSYKETAAFIGWLEAIKHKFGKIVCVPGHHERWVDSHQTLAKQKFAAAGIDLLIDEATEHMGKVIYGMPWTASSGMWAFMASPEKLQIAVDAIPTDTSILVTHGPPLGFLDQLAENGMQPKMRAGSVELTQAVYKIGPQLHVFGHIHEGSGTMQLNKTLFVNAAIMNERYKPVNTYKVIYL